MPFCFISLSGAFYVLDGIEHEISKKIDVSEPLWGVIDIYGNVKGILLNIKKRFFRNEISCNI